MDITINKPLHDNYLSIREKTLYEAIKKGEMLRVIVPSMGEGIVDPKWALEKGKLIEQVFLIPDKPMRLRAFYVDLKSPGQIKEDEKRAEEEQLKLIFGR